MDMLMTGTVGSVNASSGTVGTGAAGLASDDFMKVLIAQLRYQDPFEPMGNEQLLNQVANIRELEMNTQLTGRLEKLTDQQRFGTAAALIGKFVRGAVTDAEGNRFELEGIVTGIRFAKDGEAMLELDTGQTLPLAALTQVTTAQSQQAA